MSERQINCLIGQIQELKLSQERLQLENRNLQDRITDLELAAEQVPARRIPKVGNLIHIHRVSLPKHYHRRHHIPQDKYGVVTGVTSRWIKYVTDSHLHQRRYPEHVSLVKGEDIPYNRDNIINVHKKNNIFMN